MIEITDVKLILTSHIERLGLPGSPKQGTEKYEDAAMVWQEAFNEMNATVAELAAASRRTAWNPGKYWRDQLQAVRSAIQDARELNPAQPVEQGTSGVFFWGERDSAIASSKDCEHCEGYGLATIYHRDFAGSRIVTIERFDGSQVVVAGIASKACICDYGRWILTQHYRAFKDPKSDGDEKTYRGLGGYADVLAGRTDYVVKNPNLAEVGETEAPKAPPNLRKWPAKAF